MTDLSAEFKALANYRPTHKVRFVTAASLFDGHDAAINIMRRILQGMGAEVIHLGHNRSVDEVVTAALQEDRPPPATTHRPAARIHRRHNRRQRAPRGARCRRRCAYPGAALRHRCIGAGEDGVYAWCFRRKGFNKMLMAWVATLKDFGWVAVLRGRPCAGPLGCSTTTPLQPRKKTGQIHEPPV